MNDLFFDLSSVNVCNFVDDTTSFVYDLNLEVVLTQLVIAWFQNNYMKLNMLSVIFLWRDINLSTLG